MKIGPRVRISPFSPNKGNLMPCMKCSNGKWKYGAEGRCQFDTLESCKAAAAAIHARPNKDAAVSVMVAPDSVKVVDRDRNSTVCPKSQL